MTTYYSYTYLSQSIKYAGTSEVMEGKALIGPICLEKFFQTDNFICKRDIFCINRVADYST